MTRQVVLPGTDIPVSRISFGTARLHRLPSRRARTRVLETAAGCGCSHFDTAPYYGFGISEEELGACGLSRRSDLTIGTKVGLYPPVRRPTTLTVWARKALGKLFPRLSHPIIDWSVTAAERSLDSSLRRLRRDCIDILFLHEPMLSSAEADDYLAWLEDERRKGRIRYWGLAGEPVSLLPWLSSDHPLAMVVQTRDSLERREAEVVRRFGRDLQITYGYLSSTPRKRRSLSARAVVLQALKRNSTGSVLVSASSPVRITQLFSVLDELT